MNNSVRHLEVPRIDPAADIYAPDAAVWARVPRVALTHFHARSSDHRPAVTAQLAHSGADLHLRYEVQDRFVRSVVTALNGSVCEDSCVEFFVEPVPGGGYFNFEMNAGGTLLAHHNLGSDRTRYTRVLTEREVAPIAVRSTLPPVIDPEIAGPLTWSLTARIPVRLLSDVLGREVPIPGTWRANFYKCADRTSHPHWGSWAPVGEVLSFHMPEYFGTLAMT